MALSNFWIEGYVDRKKCDNHMADFLIYEDSKHHVYDEYEQAIYDNNDPSWTTLALAVTVYDHFDEYDYEDKRLGNSGYRLICPEYCIDGISKKRKDYADFKYYLVHLERFLDSGKDYHYSHLFRSSEEMFYMEQDKRKYKRTSFMANFIYYTDGLQYLKDEFINAAHKSEESMTTHILWDAIACLRHTPSHMPNPTAFFEMLNTKGFSKDDLDRLVQKRNRYKKIV